MIVSLVVHPKKVYYRLRFVYQNCTTTSKNGSKSRFFRPILWYTCGTLFAFVYQS